MLRSSFCFKVLLPGLMATALSGCSLTDQRADVGLPAITRGQNADCDQCNGGEPQVEYGRPNAVVDGIGWVTGIPEKILLWDRRAENHAVSEGTVNVVQQYLHDNSLTDVKVRVNQYAPVDEWRRLRENSNVHPAWRYTVGAITTLGYTLLPGRLFGGDNYNPFTNTVSLYSDIPSVGVHESAYALDNAMRRNRGLYGFTQQLDGINVWHEARASRLAHAWIGSGEQPRWLVSEGDRILPALYGSRVGSSLGSLTNAGDVLKVGGAITGHVVGPKILGR